MVTPFRRVTREKSTCVQLKAKELTKLFQRNGLLVPLDVVAVKRPVPAKGQGVKTMIANHDKLAAPVLNLAVSFEHLVQNGEGIGLGKTGRCPPTFFLDEHYIVNLPVPVPVRSDQKLVDNPINILNGKARPPGIKSGFLPEPFPERRTDGGLISREEFAAVTEAGKTLAYLVHAVGQKL